jgi:hypothetical protein
LAPPSHHGTVPSHYAIHSSLPLTLPYTVASLSPRLHLPPPTSTLSVTHSFNSLTINHSLLQLNRHQSPPTPHHSTTHSNTPSPLQHPPDPPTTPPSSFGHIAMKAPDPVRSPKLSMAEPSQYYGGGPHGNTGCRSFCWCAKRSERKGDLRSERMIRLACRVLFLHCIPTDTLAVQPPSWVLFHLLLSTLTLDASCRTQHLLTESSCQRYPLHLVESCNTFLSFSKLNRTHSITRPFSSDTRPTLKLTCPTPVRHLTQHSHNTPKTL